MNIEEINNRLSKLQFTYCVSEYKARLLLTAYLEKNEAYGLGDSDIEDLFSYAEALRASEIEDDGSDDIDILTIASAAHRQFTLSELAAFPIPLPRKVSGYHETESRIELNPKKIKDHYSLLSELTDNYLAPKYFIQPLIRGVTIFNAYEDDLRLSFFSYNKCYISKRDGIVYGHLFFNRLYTKERVCELIPELDSEKFKFYNGTLPYIKDKTISEVLAIVKQTAFVEKCEKRNNYIGSVFNSELKALKRGLYEEGSGFVKELQAKRVLPYHEKKRKKSDV